MGFKCILWAPAFLGLQNRFPHPLTYELCWSGTHSCRKRFLCSGTSVETSQSPAMAATTTDHLRNRMLGDHPAVRLASVSLPTVAGLPADEESLLPAPPKESAPSEQPCLDPPGRIRANLFIGSRETENCLAALQAAGVTHILQAGGELVPSFPDKFVYKHLSVSDEEDEDLVEAFKEAFAFIDEARKKGCVLVHCAQGMSRSGTICIGYLMWRERLSRETALAHVQQARPVVDPNEGFDLQLREFERMNCDLGSWKGWDKQRLEQCFRRHHVSGRRIVHGFSDIIRRFHVHNVTEDDTVFFDSTVML